MSDSFNRFLIAQQDDYFTALKEIKLGKKKSHWMWYIFPQIAGLGLSETSKFYAIKNLDEAKEYVNHPILGKRLKEITNELLKLKEENANKIFGSPDDMKLQSCMTLFSIADNHPDNVFEEVLNKFYNGKPDNRTVKFLEKE